MNQPNVNDLSQRRRRRSIGQAMAEFGLALPILLLVVYGVIETGRLVLIYASVVTAARNAARYGSVAGDNGFGTPYYDDCGGIIAAADRVAFLEKFKDIKISYDDGPNGLWEQDGCGISSDQHPVNGDRIRVEVSADYRPIVPLVPFSSFNISSTGNRTLLIGVPIGVDVPPVILTPGAHGELTIEKDASSDFYSAAGQVITYSYTLHNFSSDPATGIIVHDRVGTVVVGPNNCSSIASIAGGASATCTATYTISDQDVANGSVTNIAQLVATINGSQFSAYTSLTIDFLGSPQLTLTKSGTAPAHIPTGALVTYEFVLQNTGNVLLKGPYGISDLNLSSPATCPTDDLPVGGTLTCTGTHALTQQDITRGYIDNTATASARYRTDTITSPPATARVYVPPLKLTVTHTPSSVDQPGQVVTYDYTLDNRTDKSIINIAVTDTYPSATYTCGATTLAAGASTSCTRTYTVEQVDLENGYITGEATAAGETTNGKPVLSNAASLNVTVIQTWRLQLIKTASPLGPPSPSTTFTLPQNITYTYTLKNTGTVDLTGPFTVSDDKVTVDCSGASGTLAPNATKSCSNATYALTQADLDAGSVINTATATAKLASDTSKIVISDPVSVTVITYTLPRLQLTTTVNPPYWQTSATLLTFTYSLRNTGGVDLDAPYTLSQGVKVDDWNCDAATSPLPPGGTTACTGHYTTNPSDNSGTTITSKAQFTALDGTVGVDSNLYVIPVPRFVCNTSLLKHREPTPMIPNGAPTQDVIWMLANYTGLPVHIASIFVKWNAAPPNLVQIFLNGISIYNYPTSTYAGFYVPTSTGPWILPTGVDTPMEFLLTANATSMRVILTFQEVDCGIVDSNLGYPDTP